MNGITESLLSQVLAHPASHASHPLPASSVNPPRLPRDRGDHLFTPVGIPAIPFPPARPHKDQLPARLSHSVAPRAVRLLPPWSVLPSCPHLSWQHEPLCFSRAFGFFCRTYNSCSPFIHEEFSFSPLQPQANELTNEFSVGHGSALPVIKGCAVGPIKLQVTAARAQFAASSSRSVPPALGSTMGSLTIYLLRTTTLLCT